MTDPALAAERQARPGPDGPTADAELDCTGMLCPLPVYKTARALAPLGSGQVLRVTCTDPGSLKDFPAFARQRGHTLLSAEERDGLQIFHLRKEHDR